MSGISKYGRKRKTINYNKMVEISNLSESSEDEALKTVAEKRRNIVPAKIVFPTTKRRRQTKLERLASVVPTKRPSRNIMKVTKEVHEVISDVESIEATTSETNDSLESTSLDKIDDEKVIEVKDPVNSQHFEVIFVEEEKPDEVKIEAMVPKVQDEKIISNVEEKADEVASEPIVTVKSLDMVEPEVTSLDKSNEDIGSTDSPPIEQVLEEKVIYDMEEMTNEAEHSLVFVDTEKINDDEKKEKTVNGKDKVKIVINPANFRPVEMNEKMHFEKPQTEAEFMLKQLLL